MDGKDKILLCRERKDKILLYRNGKDKKLLCRERKDKILLYRNGKHTPGKQGKTWPWEKVEEDTDIEIVEEEEEEDLEVNLTS